MCTVTFIPKTKGDFILTSNRDEAPGRKTFAPEIYQEEGVQLMYPKDAVAGGTWIGLSGKKRAVSLMNGGFVSHIRKPYYRKSRRSEEHTSELQSRPHLVCRLLLEKKK